MKRNLLRAIAVALITPVTFTVMYVAGRADAATTPSRPCVVAAVGDIGKTPTSGAPTAALIRRVNPTTILGLGDLAYGEGTDSQFKKNFLAHFQDKQRPTRDLMHKFYGTPGNHEHYTENAAGFRRALPGVGRFSHYGVTVCGWRILAIDTEPEHLDTASGFILSQRRNPKYRNMPMGIFTHKPCMSNGTSHGGETGPIEPLCATARKAGAEWIASGHDHSYERFAVMGGLRQFVAGTGGADLHGFADHAPGSQRQVSEFGVLFLIPEPRGRYGWRFIDTSGNTLDRGAT